MLSLPVTPREPLQSPFAVHVVALEATQLTKADCPVITIAGEAFSVRVGIGSPTPTVTLCDVDPPNPVQVNVYVVVAASAEKNCVPLSVFDPFQPSEAVHVVTFVLDQVIVVGPADDNTDGLALIETTGKDVDGVPASMTPPPPPPPQLTRAVATQSARIILILLIRDKMGTAR